MATSICTGAIRQVLAYVRVAPSNAGAILGVAPSGMSGYRVLDAQGGDGSNWLRLACAHGITGWVRDDLIDIVGDCSAEGYGVLIEPKQASTLIRGLPPKPPEPLPPPKPPVPIPTPSPIRRQRPDCRRSTIWCASARRRSTSRRASRVVATIPIKTTIPGSCLTDASASRWRQAACSRCLTCICRRRRPRSLISCEICISSASTTATICCAAT